MVAKVVDEYVTELAAGRYPEVWGLVLVVLWPAPASFRVCDGGAGVSILVDTTAFIVTFTTVPYTFVPTKLLFLALEIPFEIEHVTSDTRFVSTVPVSCILADH